jgi:hypothetical protein
MLSSGAGPCPAASVNSELACQMASQSPAESRRASSARVTSCERGLDKSSPPESLSAAEARIGGAGRSGTKPTTAITDAAINIPDSSTPPP